MDHSNLRFTHVDELWQISDSKKVSFTGKKKTWNWDNCFFSATKQDNIKVAVRSFGAVTSQLHQKTSRINFAYDFEITEIPEITASERFEPLGNMEKIQYSENKRKSYELVLSKVNEQNNEKVKCTIWEWCDGKEIEDSGIYKVYKMLKEIQRSANSSTEKPQEIIPFLPISEPPPLSNPLDKVFPIIYQPAIDKIKNFIRQIHIFKISETIFEITIIFNNEELRNNKIFQNLYNIIRPKIYGRTEDVESFRVILVDDLATHFTFEGIYSGDHKICADTIHGDKRHWWCIGGPKKRPIEYFFSSNRHPKVYVNTSNHALAQHDNNKNLWKWEYFTWGDDNPVVTGNKCREEIDLLLNDFNETLRIKIIKSEIQKNNDQSNLDKIMKKYQRFAEREFLVDSRLSKKLVQKAINELESE